MMQRRWMEVESVVSDVEAQPRVAPLDPPGGSGGRGHDRLVGTSSSSIWIVLLHPSIHPPMASVKLAAAALAVVLACAALAATPAATYAEYRPEPEPCKTQAMYFKNCLLLVSECEKCCTGVVADPACYCEVEREEEIECAFGHHCSRNDKKVKIAEMNLPCMKNLKCKHA